MLLKKIYISIIIVLMSVAIGALAMIAVYHLPTNLMSDNIKKSLPLYIEEGLYPNSIGYDNSSVCDNFTDALMLLNAIFPSTEFPVRDAMLNPKRLYNSENNMIESLVDQLQSKGKKFSVDYYPRYWHGYLVVLKPLTSLFDILQIRLLNLLLQMIIIAYLVAYVGKNYGEGYGLSLFLSYLFLNPLSLSRCLQFSSVFYVTSFVSVVLLNNVKTFIKKQKTFYLFLLSGILTAFFDLLTYPLVSLGIPLIFFFFFFNHNNMLKNSCVAIKNTVSLSMFWGIGYAGMHIGKWFLAWRLTGYDVMKDTLSQLKYRMSYHTAVSEGNQLFGPLQSIYRNFQVVSHEPIVAILVLILLIALWKLFKMRNRMKLHDYHPLRYSLFLVMLYPFFWYSIFCNHSFVHRWFTFRLISIFIFAFGSIIATFFLEYKEKKIEK